MGKSTTKAETTTAKAAAKTVEPNVADKLDDGQSVAALPPAEEVDARSADLDHATTLHRKEFVLGPGVYSAKTDYDHEPNKAATRQYAISLGLWPVGDVRFVSNTLHEDGLSRVLTYEVDTRPAHTFTDESDHPEVVAADGDATGATNAEADKTEPDATEA